MPIYTFGIGSVQTQGGSGQTVGSNISMGTTNTTVNAQLGLLESIDKSVKDAVKGTEVRKLGSGL
jgi:hypothetical protein